MADRKKTNLEGKFRAIIETLDVANALTDPLKISIKNLLKISAADLNTDEASVIVRDGVSGDLIFLVAIGSVAAQLSEMKIPAGKGIAGFVYSSGQPLAVSDVDEQESFYAEIDRETGHSTQTILAVPLHHKDEIIGVLEYVNRIGEQPYEPFTSAEMDKAVIFSEAVSSLVNAYESAKSFKHLLEKNITDENDDSIDEIRVWLENLRQSAEHREMLELALIIKEIANRGQTERRMCIEVLSAILRYSDTTVETGYSNL